MFVVKKIPKINDFRVKNTLSKLEKVNKLKINKKKRIRQRLLEFKPMENRGYSTCEVGILARERPMRLNLVLVFCCFGKIV